LIFNRKLPFKSTGNCYFLSILQVLISKTVYSPQKLKVAVKIDTHPIKTNHQIW
jgi:hypothetical protein